MKTKAKEYGMFILGVVICFALAIFSLFLENLIPGGLLGASIIALFTGTIIVGAAIIVYSVLSAIALYTDNQDIILIGVFVLIAGIIIGLIISFYAMIKYNKGIF